MSTKDWFMSQESSDFSIIFHWDMVGILWFTGAVDALLLYLWYTYSLIMSKNEAHYLICVLMIVER